MLFQFTENWTNENQSIPDDDLDIYTKQLEKLNQDLGMNKEKMNTSN